MKRIIIIVLLLAFFTQPSLAWSWNFRNNEEYAVKKLFNAQIKYANNANFNKFITTYDPKYVSSDGFNLDIYSKLVKDIWNTYSNIKYGIEIKDIKIDGNNAIANIIETSYAELPMSKTYNGELRSIANTIYYLEKKDNKWRVISDKVLDETTTMLYGQTKDLKIQLTAPNEIEANKEYCATLEFVPPENTIAIASIASDIVEYPQKPTQEIFRAMPEDNILERLFTSNTQNTNEYIVASIGLTKTAVCDLSLKLSLTGFGYTIKRVNVIPIKNGKNDDKNK